MRKRAPARAAVGRTLGRLAPVLALVLLAGSAQAGEAPAATDEEVPAEEAAAEPDAPAQGLRAFLSQLELLPGGRALFPPLLADPKWPRFSLSYLEHLDDPFLATVGSANVGEAVTLLRGPGPFGGRWDLGLQGGVFAIFDLDASSTPLINADYLLGGFASYRRGDLALWLRLFHQSSHLGDELVLGGRAPRRINLSNDAVDALLSYQVRDWLRIYGGGGAIYDVHPNTLGRGLAQVGLELRSPRAYLGERLRPIAGLDLKLRSLASWREELSLRGGLELESGIGSLRAQLLLEYFKGRSPNGQFFVRTIEFIGFGLHFFFS
jgi:hypothetical protein